MKYFITLISLLFISVSTFSQALGPVDTSCAESLNDRANLLIQNGQDKEAVELLLQANNITKKVFGETCSTYVDNLYKLSQLYEKLRQDKKAEEFLSSYNRITIEKLKADFTFLSEKEKVVYLKDHISILEFNNNFIYNHQNASIAFRQNIFNLLLFLKSLTLTDTRNILAALRHSGDNVIQGLLKEWQETKSMMARQYSLPIKDRMLNIKDIENQSESLEKELSRRSSQWGNEQKAISVSFQEVQEGLESDEVAIEFVAFKRNTEVWNDSFMYAAYIIHKNDVAPAFVPLFEEKELQNIFNKAIDHSLEVEMDLREEVRVDSLYNDKDLYKLIWQPLEPHLKGIKKISYSPAGCLYKIAFHALQVEGETLLMDKYELQQYTSTRQVALRQADESYTKPTGITLFGNATFTMDSLQLVNQRPVEQPNGNSGSTLLRGKKRNSGAAWESLESTAIEVKNIGELFQQHSISNESFTEKTATEENLKALNGKSLEILHLATHGFFKPAPKSAFNQGNAYTQTYDPKDDDPLTRSGLILAGGNYAWSGKTPVEGVDDGNATAYEISQLDLSRTGLVVLSACETALGDIRGSEGVFGLQRAFKMAGVKKMILSLWNVPDAATAELMIKFYTNLLNGNSINESFKRAQLEMRENPDAEINSWAAFVLVE